MRALASTRRRRLPGGRGTAFLAVVLVAGVIPWTGEFPVSQAAEAPVVPSPDAPLPTVPMDDGLPGIEALESKIKEVDSGASLDEATKAKVLELYRLAVSRLQAAQALAAREATYRQAIETAPQETARIREDLKKGLAPLPAIPEGAKASDLEQLTVQAQAEVATLRANLDDLDGQLSAQGDRPSRIQAEQSIARTQLGEIEREQSLPPPAGESRFLADARVASLYARKNARVVELRALEQESVSHATRLDLLKARRDLAARGLSEAEARLKKLQEALAAARRMEAEATRQAAEDTSRDAAGKDIAVRALADQNAVLGAELTQVTELIARKAQEADMAQTRRQRIADEGKSIREKLNVIGLSDSMAQLLREQRRNLPGEVRSKAVALRRQEELAQAGLQQFRREQEAVKMGSVSAALEEFLASRVGGRVSPAERSAIAREAEGLIAAKHDLLEKLVDAYGDYRRELLRADAEETLLGSDSAAYRNYLDEQLLWSPNVPPVGRKSMEYLEVAFEWLLDAASWAAVGPALLRSARGQWLPTGLVLLAVASVLLLGRPLRRQLASIAERVGKVYTDSFSLTVRALAITLVLSAAWPLAMVYAGSLLLSAAGTDDFVHAVGQGLTASGLTLWSFIGTRLMVLKTGLGPAHFRWSERTASRLRSSLAWLGPILVPGAFIASMTSWEQTPTQTDVLGRLAFFASMLGLSAFALLTLRPAGGFLDRLIGKRLDGWTWRLRYIWFPVVVAIPLAIAGLAANGYYYAALIITARLLRSIAVIAVAVIAYDLVLRWFYVARAKIALDKARARYRAENKEASGTFEGMVVNLETQMLDLSQMDEQIGKLLRAFVTAFLTVGLWIVWDDVIPGLRVLGQIDLWPYAVTVDGHEVLRSVTLSDLVLAAIVGIFTAIAARNVPVLLEIAILRHLPVDAGSRYATVTLCRYAIVVVGFSAAFNTIGLGWNQFRWLIAAVGLGLGFGLQEIFANLVSGIMILFERPFRVGDVVTVGDMTGIVSRIRIRATTLVDWDHRELIIPNKTFITGQLINWTLSDSITRLVLKVGVAYGTDVGKAQGAIEDAIQKHPLVLADPPPAVFFVGFGESSLDFEVRVFVRKMEDRMPATHELHLALYGALGAAGIEIPFPQRDLHIRADGGQGRVEPARSEARGERSASTGPGPAPPSPGG